MKYKDIRMTVITMIINFIVLFMMVYFLSIHQMFKFCIAGLLLIMSLSMALLKFKCYIFDDSTLVYSFKGIGVFPQMIKYENIETYQLVSKHQLIIKTHQNKKVKLCIFDAQSFYNELDSQFQQYKKNNTSR